jgi:hypothetical protein
MADFANMCLSRQRGGDKGGGAGEREVLTFQFAKDEHADNLRSKGNEVLSVWYQSTIGRLHMLAPF